MRTTASESGYTLVELLVVVSLIALVIAIAAPASIAAVDGTRLNADARTLVSRIRGLQSLAQNELKRPVLSADPSGTLRVSGEPLPLPNGSAAQLIGPNKEIIFYENGTVSEGRIRLELGERTIDVAVAWLTGKPAIEAAP